MCRKVNCGNCKKPTWAGCGLHIESALQGVSPDDRCPGWKQGKCSLPLQPGASNDGQNNGGGCTIG